MIINGRYFKNPMRINEITINNKGLMIHSIDSKIGCGRLFYKKESYNESCQFTVNEIDFK